MKGKITFRTTVQKSDIRAVGKLAKLAENFRSDEIIVAKNLVRDCYQFGPQKSGYYFIFCEDENTQVVGYICYGPIACTIGSYDLYWIIIDKKMQGQGIGTKLLKMAEKKMARKKARMIYIETSSRSDYQQTNQFYLMNNYTKIAQLKDFFTVGDDRIIYQKKVAALS